MRNRRAHSAKVAETSTVAHPMGPSSLAYLAKDGSVLKNSAGSGILGYNLKYRKLGAAPQ